VGRGSKTLPDRAGRDDRRTIDSAVIFDDEVPGRRQTSAAETIRCRRHHPRTAARWAEEREEASKRRTAAIPPRPKEVPGPPAHVIYRGDATQVARGHEGTVPTALLGAAPGRGRDAIHHHAGGL